MGADGSAVVGRPVAAGSPLSPRCEVGSDGAYPVAADRAITRGDEIDRRGFQPADRWMVGRIEDY